VNRTWSQRPNQAHHRIHLGRFMGPVLTLLLVEGTFLGIGIGLNEMAYFVVGAASALGVYILWVRTRRARDVRTNREAVRLLAAGDFDAAIESFDGLCKRPNNGNALAVFLMNRGTASLCKGDFELALCIYHEVLRAEHGVARAVFKIQGDVFRARCADALAVYGDVDAAEQMLAIQKTHEPESRLGMHLLARSVIALRRGDAQGAWDHLVAHWLTAEGMHSPTELKALMLVRAFTAAQNNPSSSDPVVASLSAHDIQRNRWLGIHWHEMADFLSAFDAKHAKAESTEEAC
jgi:hypothetical protein